MIGTFGPPAGVSPAVRRLLVINGAVWLIIQFTGSRPGTMASALAFNASELLLRPWSPVTYMFVHVGFFHLLFNMIVLFFFGPMLEARWGSRFFTCYYLVAGVGGALISLPLRSLTGPADIIGASGAVYGLLMAFAMNWPDRRIYLYFMFPIKAKWLVLGLGLIALLSAASGTNDGVAHWAHLGGLLTGWIHLRFGDRIWTALAPLREAGAGWFGRGDGKWERGQASGRPSSGRTRLWRTETPGGTEIKMEPDARPRRASGSGRRTAGADEDLDEVDRILDKIREGGLGSLTPKEKEFLDEASRGYSKR
ncbi:MAG: rhomboid family intramembrane serine protease [Gemmatimonadetes bacterium]|nr:rhomboid family intramembrane serine protease [Gemmatimonadota bacterium]